MPLDRSPDIVARLAAMVENFGTILDWLDFGVVPDGLLYELP